VSWCELRKVGTPGLRQLSIGPDGGGRRGDAEDDDGGMWYRVDEGGVARLFDMSGNVWEWTDACEDPEGDAQCPRRGDSRFSDAAV
jgi:hypothetical protein